MHRYNFIASLFGLQSVSRLYCHFPGVFYKWEGNEKDANNNKFRCKGEWNRNNVVTHNISHKLIDKNASFPGFRLAIIVFFLCSQIEACPCQSILDFLNANVKVLVSSPSKVSLKFELVEMALVYSHSK